MVRGNNGNWRNFDCAVHPPIQWNLDLLDLGDILRFQRFPLRRFLICIDSTFHTIPVCMGRHDGRSKAVTTPRNVSDGSGNHHRHDCLHMRPGVGSVGDRSGLGVMVVRFSDRCSHVLLSSVLHASFSASCPLPVLESRLLIIVHRIVC
jgi:hypothetical protein